MSENKITDCEVLKFIDSYMGINVEQVRSFMSQGYHKDIQKGHYIPERLINTCIFNLPAINKTID